MLDNICGVAAVIMVLLLLFYIMSMETRIDGLIKQYNMLCTVIDTVFDLNDEKGEKKPVKDFIDELLDED